MKMIDTHAHYSHNRYPDRMSLLREMHEDGIEYIIDVGTNMLSMKHTLDLSKKLPFVYAGIGFFPHDVRELEQRETVSKFISMLENPKVVYLGEIGLDYHYDYLATAVDHKTQRKWFEWQLNLALEKDMPICIHSRDAEEDTIAILKNFHGLRGTIHCFSYGQKAMEFFVDKGFYLGVDGPITYQRNEELQRAIQLAPINRLLTETDAPYLTAEPYRKKRNDSRYMEYQVAKIANLKDVPADKLAEKLYENATTIFNFNK